MRRARAGRLRGVALSGLVALAACHGTRPGNLGARDGRLAPCPATPNCVSSQAPDDAHRIAPFRFSGTAPEAIGRMAGIVGAMPRAVVVEASDTYLRAEFRSAFFRFVDDVEFLADAGAGLLQVRSASRVGSSDLGVNRRRVEAIRARWGAAPGR